MIVAISTAAMLGGAINRIRGGWLTSTGDRCQGLGKPANAILFGLMCGIITLNQWAAVLMCGAMFGGQSFGWDIPVMRIQRDTRDWRAVLLLSLRGILWTSFFIVASAFFIGAKSLLFMPIGAMMGPIYWVCMRIYSPRSLSEIIWGAVMWAGTAAILIKVDQ